MQIIQRIILIVVLAVPVLAQSNANVVVRVVEDDQVTAVGGAEVCLVSPDDEVVAGPVTTAASGGNAGVARFNSVASGTYDMVASAPSFIGSRLGPVVVANTNLDRTVPLQAGDPALGPDCNDPDGPEVEPTPPIGLGPGAGPNELPSPVDGILNVHQLVISDLVINGGSGQTESPNVELNWTITYLDVPFQYRVSVNDDIENAPWVPLANTNVVSAGVNIYNQIAANAAQQVGPNSGPKSIVVQVRNGQDTAIVSNVIEADVFFQAMALVTIDAGDAYEFARNNGWDFDYEGDRFLINNCKIRSFETPELSVNALHLETRRSIFGFLYRGATGCLFQLFDGRELNEPWTFSSTSVIAGESGTLPGGESCGGVGNTGGISLPEPGASVIPISVTVASDNICFAVIPSIVLRGPEGVPWTEAFIE